MRARRRIPGRMELQRSSPVTAVPSANVPATSLHNTLLSMQRAVGNQSVLHSLRSLRATNESEFEAQAEGATRQAFRPQQLSSSRSQDAAAMAAPLAESGKGVELDPQIRKPMEARLRADLSRVTIHRGATASAMNRNLNSRAFALGQGIYFGDGEYQPHTDTGSRLLTHELAHTVQQQSGKTAILRQPKGTPQQQPAITAQGVIGLTQGSKVLLGRTMSNFIF